jgi:urea transporter
VFQFPSEAGGAVCCWRCAIRYPPMLRRSVRIALVVGTLLALINHGDSLLQGRVTTTLALKILLTYTVPFTVATWSALVNSRGRKM